MVGKQPPRQGRHRSAGKTSQAGKVNNVEVNTPLAAKTRQVGVGTALIDQVPTDKIGLTAVGRKSHDGLRLARAGTVRLDGVGIALADVASHGGVGTTLAGKVHHSEVDTTLAANPPHGRIYIALVVKAFSVGVANALASTSSEPGYRWVPLRRCRRPGGHGISRWGKTPGEASPGHAWYPTIWFAQAGRPQYHAEG